MYVTNLKKWFNHNRQKIDSLYGMVCLSLPFLLLTSVITAFALGGLPGNMKVVSSYASPTSFALASSPHMSLVFKHKKTGEVFAHNSFSGLDIVLPKGVYHMETHLRYSVNGKQHMIIAVQEYEVME